ncbi:hypothetical protein [Iodobacter fluviatilis]|uniref:Uncharacterized protein n=1 Tax=Iodobacter fluviatilis TaxID=537 RepID=A0A377SY12_9NEIS|nr:hypothetical protein [Iodobacter fluviatilis]TCU83400.1 hypothetical protein EV682_112123 [Iodobacter fluviatilis]STR45883.1 Uncharacterised protein [Iodobacter fluviatilis]
MDVTISPAFRADGTMVQLSELLTVIPDNVYVWSVIDFYGIGEAPEEFSMEEFEKQTMIRHRGFIMNWLELKMFAENLIQTVDCLIVGANYEDNISSIKLMKNDYSSCEIVIQAFDSSEWAVWAHDSTLASKLAMVF